jgi:hypothetical protein
MYRVTFDEFLQRATIYERTPVLISPRLRRCAWLSWPVIAVCSSVFYSLPNGDILRSSIFFLWTREWMVNLWNFLAANRSLLLEFSLAIMALSLALCVLTRAYHQAQIALHVALFVPVAYASAGLLFVLVLLLPILANLIVWILLFILAASVCIFLLGLILSAGNR